MHPDNWHWRDGSDKQPGECIIFDLDGVLADARHRQHHLQNDPPQWHGFFDAAGEDAVIESSAAILKEVDESVTVIFLTGRPARIEPLTLRWIEENKLRWDLLIMRNWGNYAAAREFKRDSVRKLKTEGWVPVVVYEDDDAICQMYAEEGIKCVYVDSGYYENRVVRFPRTAGETDK